jgi:hypothetical protein
MNSIVFNLLHRILCLQDTIDVCFLRRSLIERVAQVLVDFLQFVLLGFLRGQ